MSEELNKLQKQELIRRNQTLVQAFEKEKLNHAATLHELTQLKRMIFGQKSERFVPEHPAEQLTLFGDLEEALEAKPKQKVAYEREVPKKRKEKPFRQPLPAHFERIRIVIPPDEDLTGWKKIGEEITEELDFIPGKFIVNQYVREKFVNPNNEDLGVKIAKLPTRPIEKGIPGPTLLAHLLISKFADHLPLYRQAQQYKRIGYEIPHSTLGGWQRKTCELLEPLYVALRKMTLRSTYLQADETPIPVHDKKTKGKMSKGYHWVYHAVVERLVLFDYRPGRMRAGPVEILHDFKGWLQTDGYSAYDAFENKREIFLVACLAHIRRYFEKALDNDPEQASKIMVLIQQLYVIEREAREKELAHEQRKELRTRKAVPIIDELRKWAVKQTENPTFLPGEPLAKAHLYLCGRFKYLERYLLDGRLEIDNNLIENQIRPVALGRKNYLFAGSHSGARQAAMIYSFIATCKRNQIEPFAWLTDVIRRISDHKVNKLDELIPGKWAALDSEG